MSYQKEAQIHSLSLLANAAFDLQEISFQQLQSLTSQIVSKTLANSGVQNDIGNWQQIWGPVVFSNNATAQKVVADNTMMLLYNQNSASPLFVVGIAGTNAVSMYGWMQEDFQVNALVNWGDIVSKSIPGLVQPAISAGTNTGLNILLNMKGPELTTGNTNTVTMLTALNDYIAAHAIKNAEVAVAGHSLGGALAPVLAMYMHDTLNKWNTSGNVSVVSAWPTAGPTPGNGAFAKYVKNATGTTFTYTSRYNTLDVVPQAWQSATMQTIPQIYGSNIPYPEPSTDKVSSTTVGTMVAIAFLKTINTGAKIDKLPIDYEQIQPWNPMTGTFDANTDSNAKLEANILTGFEPGTLANYSPYLVFLYRFLKQMGFQHTTAYNSLLGITDFAAEFNLIKSEITGASEEERSTNALHLAMSKYYGLPNLSALVVPEAEEAVA